LLNVKQIVTGKWKENCYIISCLNSDALIIDPGGEEKNIVKYIKEKNLNVYAILNTHAHYDHLGAVKSLKDRYKVPFYLHSKDETLLRFANLYVKVFEGVGLIQIPQVDYFYDQINAQYNIEDFSIQILSTPGHTCGSVCIQIENCLFTGDTLFRGKIGRTDLPGGNEQSLIESMQTISKLPKDLIIYPGHGKRSTIGNEFKYNLDFTTALLWA
jgi:hydroxyacylglutathione hydrolase